MYKLGFDSGTQRTRYWNPYDQKWVVLTPLPLTQGTSSYLNSSGGNNTGTFELKSLPEGLAPTDLDNAKIVVDTSSADITSNNTYVFDKNNLCTVPSNIGTASRTAEYRYLKTEPNVGVLLIGSSMYSTTNWQDASQITTITLNFSNLSSGSATTTGSPTLSTTPSSFSFEKTYEIPNLSFVRDGDKVIMSFANDDAYYFDATNGVYHGDKKLTLNFEFEASSPSGERASFSLSGNGLDGNETLRVGNFSVHSWTGQTLGRSEIQIINLTNIEVLFENPSLSFTRDLDKVYMNYSKSTLVPLSEISLYGNVINTISFDPTNGVFHGDRKKLSFVAQLEETCCFFFSS